MNQELEERYSQTSFTNIVGLAWIFTQKHLKEFTVMAFSHLVIGLYNGMAIVSAGLLMLLTCIPAGVCLVFTAKDAGPQGLAIIVGALLISLVLLSTANGVAESIVEASAFNEINYQKNYVGDGILSKKWTSVWGFFGDYWACYFDFIKQNLMSFALVANLGCATLFLPEKMISIVIAAALYIWLLYTILIKSFKYNFLPFVRLSNKFPEKKEMHEHVKKIPAKAGLNLSIQCLVISVLAYQLPSMVAGVATGPAALISIFNSNLAVLASIPALILSFVVSPASKAFVGIMKAIHYDIQTRHDFNPPGKVSAQAKSMYIVVILVVIATYTLSMINSFTSPEFQERMKRATEKQQSAEDIARKQAAEKFLKESDVSN